ncbi:hypothetical protein LER27_28705 [Pseudomonas aeruginosa]|uniref:hypothetical protein n=1 Tax=Pseudomonas aeruginosa TaxID=287 RepID=UPI00053EE66C|nr:hypothetical protein [Pseudomonas aeruginosa]ELK4796406.1 hypothetical protein [Pseudomonas aeruginosa]MBG4551248.1 hypothetical protein [Pseudomonas aeruginosa]MBG5240322.1 hypothetical protein [Pseudomonas aeruginosa]MBG7505874.1 hypothetical protein [Pseudomonas aeruginosa]MBH3767386.1 hypothetical protein [Pseudomonas aeruginosa]
MSGSSNTESFGTFSSNETACDSLVLDTQLASPKEAVVDLIEIGDVLDVALGNANGLVTVEVLRNGQVAGGVASPNIQRLLTCMKQGTVYIATVYEKIGGQVKIRISPAGN